jgi:ferritin-like metal-binding protein YciE
MSLNTIDELLVEEIKDIYSAETQLLQALPELASAASSQELKDGFEQHLHETEEQVQRLEQVFNILGIQGDGKTCEGMAGLIRESRQIVAEPGDPAVKDAALIAAAQKVEHYEIATYGTICALADQLDDEEVKDILGRNLESEKDADDKLTRLAQGGLFSSGINKRAEQSRSSGSMRSSESMDVDEDIEDIRRSERRGKGTDMGGSSRRSSR